MSEVSLYDRLDFGIVEQADPVDLDQVLARFLIRLVRQAKCRAQDPLPNVNENAPSSPPRCHPNHVQNTIAAAKNSAAATGMIVAITAGASRSLVTSHVSAAGTECATTPSNA